MVGKYSFQGGYNLEAAKMIQPICGNVKLFLVGGLRSVVQMEEIVKKGYVDFISMSRPFIREPLLVERIKQGKTDAASCVSCNKCLAAMVNNMPLRCYHEGFPEP
jgi:2,4-dienoyl-CoA reductase-like NADH-dependent reductase (Old Yellow Enzyme family)